MKFVEWTRSSESLGATAAAVYIADAIVQACPSPHILMEAHTSGYPMDFID